MSASYLPMGCSIYVCSAAGFLEDSGITNRVLRLIPKEKIESHVVLFFYWNGKVRAYDQNGTVTLPRKFRIRDKGILLGKAWIKINKPSTKFTLKKVEDY